MKNKIQTYDFDKARIYTWRKMMGEESALEGFKEFNMKWEDTYAGYVIREKKGMGMFVGPTSEMHRVALRQLASRFTKAEALEYIKNGFFCKKGGEFIIEDAT